MQWVNLSMNLEKPVNHPSKEQVVALYSALYELRAMNARALAMAKPEEAILYRARMQSYNNAITLLKIIFGIADGDRKVSEDEQQQNMANDGSEDSERWSGYYPE